MPDEVKQTTETTPPVPGNDQTARNPDGSLKDQQTSQSSGTTEALATQKPDTKADDSLAAKTTDGGDKKAADAPVVPDKYEFKAPDGYEVSAELIEKATPILKDLKIDQAGAQKLFDVVATEVAKTQTNMVEFWENMQSDWKKEVVADKEVGNGKDGLSADASQNIKAAIDALPAELQGPFKDTMNLTGAGNNLAFVKAMALFGKAYREGTHVKGGQPSPLGQRSPGAGPRSAASAMFPNLPQANSGS